MIFRFYHGGIIKEEMLAVCGATLKPLHLHNPSTTQRGQHGVIDCLKNFNSQEGQNAVGITFCCRSSPAVSSTKKKKTLISSRCQLTQDESAIHCRCEIATLKLDGHFIFSTEIEVYSYLVALIDCRLPSSWACNQLQFTFDFGDTNANTSVGYTQS